MQCRRMPCSRRLLLVVGLVLLVGEAEVLAVPAVHAPIPLDLPPAVRQEVERLRSPDPETRVLAAGALGRMGEVAAPAVPFLMAALADPTIAQFGDHESAVPRKAAADALARIGRPAVQSLIEALSSKHAVIRTSAIGVLGRLGDEQAIGPLIVLLEHRDDETRNASVEALAVIGPAVVKPLAAEFVEPRARFGDFRSTAERVLAKIGDPAVGPLLEEFLTGNRNFPGGALERIGSPSAADALIATLEADSAKARHWAAYFLGKMRSKRAVEPLIAALRDKNYEVRVLAAHSLGKIGDRRAVAPLLAMLEDLHWNVRGSAVTALGELGDTRTTEPVIAMLNDVEYHVRCYAATALGKLGDKRAVEPLIATLCDRRENDTTNPDHRQGQVRQAAADALALIGDARAVPALIEALNEPLHWQIRRDAAWALKRLNDRRAVGPLIDLLDDEHHEVRQVVADALGQLGDPAATTPLAALLYDAQESVRTAAAIALGQVKDPRGIKPLIAALADQDGSVRAAAAESLKAITGQSLGRELKMWLRWWEANRSNLPGADAGWLLVEARCRAQKPQTNEHRAFWCHSAFGPAGMEWEKSIRILAENGFTAILPNMLWGGAAFYESKVLPVATDVKEKGDQIAITRRHKTGGFTIFQFGVPEARQVVPLCGMGVTREQ